MTSEGPPPPDEDAGRWLAFARTRAGRRQERQEVLRGRLRAGAGGAAAVLLVAGLLAWSPWTSQPPPDTGDALLGGDRATVLLVVRGDGGTPLLCGLLGHDRAGRRGSVVVVPTELMLPVPGEGRLTVAEALDRAGPTLTRDALGDALGVRVDGSWVLPRAEFTRFVEVLGGVEVTVDRAVTREGQTVVPAGARRLDGGQVLAYAAADRGPAEGSDASGERAEHVLRALAEVLPQTFTGMRGVLGSLGVVGDAGLPVDRLAAVLSGVARDGAAERLRAGTLPVDGASRGLDAEKAAALVRDLLGGQPRTSLADVTPRVMVRLPANAPRRLGAEVRASLVGAGYEYVEGGSGPRRDATAILAPADRPDARPVAEAVALALGLDTAAVRTSGDVLLGADVLVVVGSDLGA